VFAICASVVSALKHIVISIAFALFMTAFRHCVSALADKSFAAGFAILMDTFFAGEVAAVKAFVILTVADTVIQPTVGVTVVTFTYVSSADLTRVMVTFCTAEVAAVGYLVFFVVIILAGVVFAARQVYVVTLPAGVVTAVKHTMVAGIADIVEAMDHVMVAAFADSVIAAFCDGVVFGEHDHFPTAFTKLFAAVNVFTPAEISLTVYAKGMVPFLAGEVAAIKQLVGITRHTAGGATVVVGRYLTGIEITAIHNNELVNDSGLSATGTADDGRATVAVVSIGMAEEVAAVAASVVVARDGIAVAAIH